MKTATVIGAGPTGLNTAVRLKESGWDVQVLEEHPEVGRPVHCSGLISASGTEELGIDVSSITLNEIFGAKIHSPSGVTLQVERKQPVAHVTSRADFDKLFYKKAVKLDIPIEFNSKLINVNKQTVFFQKLNRGEITKSMYVIGADGVQSKTRELLGINVPRENFVHTYQELCEGSFDPKFVEVFFGSFAKGLFAWIIPHSKKIAEYGIGVTHGSINPEIAFSNFFRKEKGLELAPEEKDSSLIPVGPPLKEIVKDNVMLVGDAAFHAKATTGGGLMLGIQASDICAQTLSSHMKNKTSLQNYSKNMAQLNKELLMHWKIREYMNSLPDNDIDRLFEKAKKAGVENFLSNYGDMDKPSRFVGKILTTPSLWQFVPLALKFRA